MVGEIACPLDGTTVSEPVIEEDGYTGHQCQNCGSIYVSPRPSREEIAELYAEGDAYLTPAFFLATANSLTGRLTARHNVRLVKRHASGGSLLEIGPGNGAFLAEASRQGFEVVGVELNPPQASFIENQRKIPCVTSLAEARHMGPSEFDVVYHCDVLSHFYEPVDDMREIAALLRPGGLHVFETGNLGDVDRRHFPLFGTFQYPDHLFQYSERGLHSLLHLSGFEHVKTYRYSRLPELLLRSQIRRVTHRGQAERDHRSGPASDTRPATPSRKGRIARDALDLTYLGIRLSAGRLVIRKDDPQTLIVVARKRG